MVVVAEEGRSYRVFGLTHTGEREMRARRRDAKMSRRIAEEMMKDADSEKRETERERDS